MESADDDPVGFAQLRSGSGYVERTADSARRAHGAGSRSAGEVGVSARFKHHYNLSRDALHGRSGSVQRDNNDLYDTAPFDVEAFLVYLNNGYDETAAATAADYYGGDTHLAYSDHGLPDHPNDGRTHYYGDDCPGGHYNDLPASPDDDYTSDAYYDGFDYDDNDGTRE